MSTITEVVFRVPYVGDGPDGCRRSAQIDREEADTLALDDPRRTARVASAQAWDAQARELELAARLGVDPFDGGPIR